LGVLWGCFGCVVGMFCVCCGDVLRVSWGCFVCVVGMFCVCRGDVLCVSWDLWVCCLFVAFRKSVGSFFVCCVFVCLLRGSFGFFCKCCERFLGLLCESCEVFLGLLCSFVVRSRQICWDCLRFFLQKCFVFFEIFSFFVYCIPENGRFFLLCCYFFLCCGDALSVLWGCFYCCRMYFVRSVNVVAIFSGVLCVRVV